MQITNNGLDMIGTGYPFHYCNVGTGTLPANLTSATGLNNWAFNVSGGSSPANTISRSPSTPFYVEQTLYFKKDNIDTGYILKEVSLGNSTDNSNIFCIDKIRDINGEPTSVEVLVGDSFQVTAKVRIYANETPVIVNISANQDMPAQTCTVVPDFTRWGFGSEQYIGHSYFGCIFSADAFSQDITIENPGTGYPNSSTTWSDYVNSSYYRDVTLSFDANNGNVVDNSQNATTIVQIITSSYIPNPIKIGLSPGFTKTNAYTASLTLRFSWSRHT